MLLFEIRDINGILKFTIRVTGSNPAPAKIRTFLLQSLKSVRKSIEDSLRTSNSRNKNEELDVRKRRCAEFVLGENVASAVHVVSLFTNHGNEIKLS